MMHLIDRAQPGMSENTCSIGPPDVVEWQTIQMSAADTNCDVAGSNDYRLFQGLSGSSLETRHQHLKILI